MSKTAKWRPAPPRRNPAAHLRGHGRGAFLERRLTKHSAAAGVHAQGAGGGWHAHAASGHDSTPHTQPWASEVLPCLPARALSAAPMAKKKKAAPPEDEPAPKKKGSKKKAKKSKKKAAKK